MDGWIKAADVPAHVGGASLPRVLLHLNPVPPPLASSLVSRPSSLSPLTPRPRRAILVKHHNPTVKPGRHRVAPPAVIADLVERFARNREAYRSGPYNETQLRREFVDPFFKALGWDLDNEQGYAEAYKDVIHEDAIRIAGGRLLLADRGHPCHLPSYPAPERMCQMPASDPGGDCLALLTLGLNMSSVSFAAR